MKHLFNRVFWIVNLALLPQIVNGVTTSPVERYIPTTGVGDNQVNINPRWYDLKTIIAFMINFAIAISGAILVIMLLVGGIMYLTGAGNEDQTGKAKKLMIDAVIGLFIVMSVYAIASFVINAFK